MRRVCLLAVALAAAGPTLDAEGFELRKVMLTGETAPGIEPGLIDEIGTYVDIFTPSPFAGLADLGPRGGTAIVAEHGGDGSPSTRDSVGSGVWRSVAGALERVALEGDVAPGTGLTFGGFPVASPADHGDGVAFVGSVRDGRGLWSSRGGTVRKLLLEGEPLLGMPPGATLFLFAFAGRGAAVLVEANWCDPASGCGGPNEGLWRDLDGTLRPVVRRGDAAPGFGRGAVFDDVSNASARTGPVDFWNGSEAGHVIFNGYVTGPHIDAENNEGLWVEGPSGLTLLAREGDRVPGTQGFRWGAKSGFQSFGDFTVMRAHILTANGLALWGASIHTGRWNRLGGMWSTRSGQVVQLVQTVRRDAFVADQPPITLATPAPGFAAPHRFRQIFAGRMNGGGEIYFDADVVEETQPEGPPKAAIFHIPAGSDAIELFAALGGPAPALPGLTLVEARIGRLFETGHYLWVGRLQGPAVDASNDLAAFLTAPGGDTRVLLRTGETVDVQGDGSDLRVLADFGTDTGPRGGGSILEQVFELLFHDGSSGVFIGRLVP